MCEILRIDQTPLIENNWAPKKFTIPEDTIGEIILHRDGTWSFECEFNKETWRIYSCRLNMDIDDKIYNFCEFVGRNKEKKNNG